MNAVEILEILVNIYCQQEGITLEELEIIKKDESPEEKTA